MRTPSQRLADLLLGEAAEDWIKREREKGDSWRRISLTLRDKTDAQVDISPATLMAWMGEAEPTAAAS